MTNGHINPANVPDIALKDGHSIPQVGLGVLRIEDVYKRQVRWHDPFHERGGKHFAR